jgi:hypothetical protein
VPWCPMGEVVEAAKAVAVVVAVAVLDWAPDSDLVPVRPNRRNRQERRRPQTGPQVRQCVRKRACLPSVNASLVAVTLRDEWWTVKSAVRRCPRIATPVTRLPNWSPRAVFLELLRGQRPLQRCLAPCAIDPLLPLGSAESGLSDVESGGSTLSLALGE